MTVRLCFYNDCLVCERLNRHLNAMLIQWISVYTSIMHLRYMTSKFCVREYKCMHVHIELYVFLPICHKHIVRGRWLCPLGVQKMKILHEFLSWQTIIYIRTKSTGSAGLHWTLYYRVDSVCCWFWTTYQVVNISFC